MSDILHPEIPPDRNGFTLQELLQHIALDEHFVVECVEHGIAQVPGRQPDEWVFSVTAVLRIRKAWRLHRDLDLHVGSLGLILELLDQRDTLQQEVALLRDRLNRWELP